MAYFDSYKIAIGDTGDIYPVKYNNFVGVTENYATELENARQGETSLLVNLQNNYIGYTLSENISGASSTYKCINMANAVDPQDYITWSQAQSMAGSAEVPSDISAVGVGSLNPNDILVVNSAGTAITGRPTTYTAVPSNSVINGNYDMNLSGGSKATTLPVGSVGAVISYADVGGYLSSSVTLTITPNGTEKIMGTIVGPQTLTIDDFPFCSFDLVYVSASFGWSLARLQR